MVLDHYLLFSSSTSPFNSGDDYLPDSPNFLDQVPALNDRDVGDDKVVEDSAVIDRSTPGPNGTDSSAVIDASTPVPKPLPKLKLVFAPMPRDDSSSLSKPSMQDFRIVPESIRPSVSLKSSVKTSSTVVGGIDDAVSPIQSFSSPLLKSPGELWPLGILPERNEYCYHRYNDVWYEVKVMKYDSRTKNVKV